MSDLMLNPRFVQHVGAVLLHSLWQFAMIAMVMSTILRFMGQRNSNLRYWVCVCGMIVMVLAPAGTIFLFRAPTISHQPSAPVTASAGITVGTSVTQLAGQAEPVRSNVVSRDFNELDLGDSPALEPADILAAAQNWFPTIVLGWLLGVLLMTVRPIGSWVVLAKLRREANAVPEHVADMLTSVAQKIEVTVHVRAMQSLRVAVPMVTGYFQPVILLPASMVTGLPATELKAILLHELAHIRRHDFVINLTQIMVETLFFYHPAVWWLSAHVRREREHCCDELAASILGDRAEYGRALLAVEELRFAVPSLALGMHGGSLLQRVRRLSGGSTTRPNVTAFLLAWALLVAICVTLWSGIQVHADDAPTTDVDKESWSAKAIAVRAHREASAVDTLPQFLVRADAGTRTFKPMKDSSPDPLANLMRSIDEPIVDEDWYRYESTFAWSQDSFLNEMYAPHMFGPDQPQSKGSNPPMRNARWGTPSLGGETMKSGDRPVFHVLRKDTNAMWSDMSLSNPNYFLITTHELPFGDNSYRHQCFNMVPPTESQFRQLGRVEFDGESCHLIESRTRQERLWISRKTGLIRAYVQMQFHGESDDFHKSPVIEKIAGRTFASSGEYHRWWRKNFDELSVKQQQQINTVWAESVPADELEAGLLVRFRDYREIKKGVWWPFREDRSQGYESDDVYHCMLSTYAVKEIRLDDDMSDRMKAFQPRPGEKVQDQRFAVPINYVFGDKTEDELLELVDAEYATQVENKQTIKRLQAPFEKLVGRAAPELPSRGWIGGRQPTVAGKPYLVHFWATWCGPCKRDFPLLRRLQESGQIIGMHPSGTETDVIGKVIADGELNYPTFVSPDGNSDLIAGYPTGMYPYYVLVDADGSVTSHGFLTDDDSKLVHDFAELNQAVRK